MKKRVKRVVGLTALLGAFGAVGAVLLRKKLRMSQREEKKSDVWARPGMKVVFRAELMPGRDGSERIFRVKQLLPNGRVILHDFVGEHTEKEFEPIR